MTGFESAGGFFTALVSIVAIDLMLAGDNAVVIAMAVKNLPPKTRRLGVVLGSVAAILIRVACTLVVAKLLTVPYVRVAGGAAVIWIAVNLLSNAEADGGARSAGSLWQALLIVVIADLSMGIDNMLAVGAASRGNGLLIFFGLCLSVPFIVFTSSWLAGLMDRYPLVLTVGAALLGKVGAEMIVTDPLVRVHVPPGGGLYYTAVLLAAAAVVAAGKYRLLLKSRESLSKSVAGL